MQLKIRLQSRPASNLHFQENRETKIWHNVCTKYFITSHQFSVDFRRTEGIFFFLYFFACFLLFAKIVQGNELCTHPQRARTKIYYLRIVHVTCALLWAPNIGFDRNKFNFCATHDWPRPPVNPRLHSSNRIHIQNHQTPYDLNTSLSKSLFSQPVIQRVILALSVCIFRNS